MPNAVPIPKPPILWLGFRSNQSIVLKLLEIIRLLEYYTRQHGIGYHKIMGARMREGLAEVVIVKELSRAEKLAAERHRVQLSGERGWEVSEEEALEDWLQNHSNKWRLERHARMLAMEREEIMRHKWIESEKGNHDVGAEAVFDWIRKYAALWRQWFEDEYDGHSA